MYRIKSHTGQDLDIPGDIREDNVYYATMSAEAIDYYHNHGYVVVRRLIPRADTARIRAAFAGQIKTSDRFIYRQTTSKPERNVFDKQGYVRNPVLNVQSLAKDSFGDFRGSVVECFAGPPLQNALKTLFGEPVKLVQSMYFEGNTATAPHQDTFYLDSEKLGTMCAAWIALEDIAPNAGRFFVCPGSHKTDLRDHGLDFDVAGDPRRYEAIVLDVLRKLDLDVVAPALEEGDVLFWNARTIHGSLESPGATSSRQSLTAHFIPSGDRFMQLQARIKPLPLERINGVEMAMVKSQDRFRNRCILWVETRLPWLFYPLRAFAIRQVTRRTNA